MKKILISGPILSRSGYGEMARFAFRSLKNLNNVDLYLLPTSWGNTGWLFENNEERRKIDELVLKTQLYIQSSNNNPSFDMSLQISIPNEWKKLAPVNIGYTAGIETNFISPSWLENSNLMDKIIVISEHAKSGFINTIFGNQNGQQFKVKTPVEVVHLPFRDLSNEPLEISLKHDFNFLSVCQWSPRKNLEQAIIGFLEEFCNEEVGLVLKINTANDSIMDREHTTKRLKILLSNYPNRKCSITLLHGHLKDEQMSSLYKNTKIKAIVSTTHGEGYGLPLMEAAANGLPVIATDWSGHIDFLYMLEDGKPKRMFGKIDCDIKPIAQEHVWKGVLEEGTSWAYPKMVSYKSKLRDCYKDYQRYKSQSKKLSVWVKETFSEEKLHNKFASSLGIKIKNKAKREINGISFCVPTNGKRKDITNLLIKSIKKQNWNNMDYEIILCGDVQNFVPDSNLKLINKKEDANSRKVAVLRNTAANNSKYDTIVFCDDDVILSDSWLLETIKYSKENAWDVLSNKVLLPDGGRYWDRASLSPHRMVDYDHPENDMTLYQSSAFLMVRKEVFDDVKWDESKLVYADREGQVPEDVQYSLDLHSKDYVLSFNKNCNVWHYDDSYIEWNKGNSYEANVCLKKEIITKKYNLDFFPPHSIDFKNTLKGLE